VIVRTPRGPGTGPSSHDGSGEMLRRVGELDWAATPLGPRGAWPASLTAAVRILLTSRFSMWMAWGPELTMFYNDAYWRDTLRTKHPWALGRPAREVWAEIWDDIGPRIESVLRTSEATWDEDLLLFLERSGYAEETYHTFSYSPLSDDSGAVAGMLCVVTENTDRVLSERRMATLRDLASALASARTEADVVAAVTAQLAANRQDLPFSLTYLFDDEGVASLACATGVDAAAVEVPQTADGWPIDRVRAGETVVVDGLGERFGTLPAGAWACPPTAAVAVPLPGAPGEEQVRGCLVVGLNPYRAFDDRYRGFVELLATQTSSALVSARAYEAERRRAQALAELDRAKTEFFTGISHEFRTPLTLIGGPVRDLLDQGVEDPKRARTELAVVERNIGRLRRLVDNLLDFSRVQAGRAQARYAPTDLAAVTADLASMFRSAVERAGLRLAADLGEVGEPVWVDRSMWEKVVLNLVSNALKYTLHGVITVAVGRVGGHAVLTVADTGVGIPAGELPRLFDRFHQVAGSAGRSAEGSGIGLALVRELVGLHGGGVDVASQVGVGTTFTVRVPLGTAHLPADQLAEPAATPEGSAEEVAAPYLTEALRWLSGTDPNDGTAAPIVRSVDRPWSAGAPGTLPRVLVVDDNTDMREYLSRLLGGQYAVRTAEDGVAALAAVRVEPPDLVVTDVMMPRLDGFGLVAALRAEPATATLPVMVLSARAGQESAVEGLAAGADDYLVKPFTATELLARIRSLLTLAQVRRREAAWRGALLGALRDGMFVINGAGQVVQINEGFTEILGYGPEGLPYDVPHPWWPDPEADPDGHARVTAALAAVQSTGRGRHLLVLYHRDGHRLWVETSTDTIPDPDRTDGLPMLIGVARDVTAAQQAAQRDRLLAEAGQILAGPDEPDGGLVERLQRVADRAATVLDDLVVVVRAGIDGRLPPVAAGHPHRPELAAAMLELAPYRIPAALAGPYRRGRAFVLDPTPPELVREALGAEGYDVRVRIGLGASLVAPLTVQGRLLGLLLVICPRDHPRRHAACSPAPLHPGSGTSCAPVGRFDRTDVELAEELARRIAIALETERIAAREHQLNAASAALAAAASVPEAAVALAAAVRDALDAQLIAVFVPHPDSPSRWDLVHSEGLPAPAAERHGAFRTRNRTAIGEAARTSRPVWAGDPHDCRNRFPDGLVADDDVDVQALAALPLRLAGRTIGVVGIGFATPREFPAAEREFATTLVGQAAQAFERASLTDTRWDVAQTLQNALLPASPPAIDRLALATRYRPGVAGVQAGGDWYDVLALDAHRTDVVVGDVVGQGAPAAAVMGQLRAGLSAILTMLGPRADPAHALARLHDYTSRVPGARGSAAVCVIIDTERGRIRWSRAGHPPPLLLTGHGGVQHLDGGAGPLLGAFTGVDSDRLYRAADAAFAPGDTVLVYTDGLVERRGEVIDDGIERLGLLAGQQGGAPPARLAGHLLAAMVTDGRVHDDIALVAARHLPAALYCRHPAQPTELTGIRRAVEAWAAANALPEDITDDLQLALGEAIANAVEHAYRDHDPGEVEYTLRCSADGAHVEAVVTDFGSWRPPPADRGHRGRGLELINALGRDVAVDHGATGTVVRFTVDVPAGVSAPSRRDDGPQPERHDEGCEPQADHGDAGPRRR
jgi:PAS domain S-box-containing protein